MSKSYKNTPIIRDSYGSKWLPWCKRHANKKVRRELDVPRGKAYKKLYESWDIHDYSFRQTFQEHLQQRESDLKHYLNVYGSVKNIPPRLAKQFYDLANWEWKKWYYRK